MQVLAEGGLLGLPTDSSYAIAACGLSPAPVARLLSSEFDDCRCSYLGWALSLASAQAAEDYIAPDQTVAMRLARRCWPGPIALRIGCEDPDAALSRLPAEVRAALTHGDPQVSLRVVAHSFVQQLHRFLAGPIVLATLCDAAGKAITSCDPLPSLLGDRIPLLLDDGPTRYGGEATVVRTCGADYTVVHEGVVESAAIDKFAKPLIALVCTGNTCRSPMAEVLLRKRLRDQTGSEQAVNVVSAGIAAFQGDVASGPAVEIMQQRGLDLSAHRSQPMTEQLLQMADIVLTMTRGHRDAILARFPEAAPRIHTLRVDGGDIADPVGAPLEVYQQCADQIDEQLTIWVERLQSQWDSGAGQ